MNRLFIVVPCYNEEEVLPETSRRLREKLLSLISAGEISSDSRIVLVDDGSSDSTWEIIEKLHGADIHFDGLRLSRNRGHQNALLAGLMEASSHADMVISMDADLQDDINAIDAMMKKYREGCDIVFGVRSSRKKDKFLKRFTAESYYNILRAMGVEIVYNHADYRLMSRRSLEALARYEEVNLFLRGIVPTIGFETAVVEYERAERYAGESKYPLRKMLALAADGITSFSVRPIRMILSAGFVVFSASIILLLIYLIGACMGSDFSSLKFLTFSVFFTAGLIITAVGVVGEYVSKIYLETKRRPRYIIESKLHIDE